MGVQGMGFPVYEAQERAADKRRALALKLAAKHYTHEEFRELERDLEAGRVDIRIYDDGLVLMRLAT